MKTLAGITASLLLAGCVAWGQTGAGGTVNSQSTDPQQNQKMTGAMGTSNGQPNDVTPGSASSPNGGVQPDRTMTGSDSNGNYNQPLKASPQSTTGSTPPASQGASSAHGKRHKKHSKNGDMNHVGQTERTGTSGSGATASQTDMGATNPNPKTSSSASPNAGSPPPHQ